MKPTKKDVQPLEVIKSLQEYLMKHGEQNTACLLMYEAMCCIKSMVEAGNPTESVKRTEEYKPEYKYCEDGKVVWTNAGDAPVVKNAEPVTLKCQKCGSDRSKEPCEGNLMECSFKGEAQQNEPVKVLRERELTQALSNLDPLVRELMNRLGSGEACGGLDGDQSKLNSTTQVLLRAIDKFEERVLVGNQLVKVPLGGEILKVWDEGKGMPSRMMTNADNSCLIQFARSLLEKYTAPKPRTDK